MRKQTIDWRCENRPLIEDAKADHRLEMQKQTIGLEVGVNTATWHLPPNPNSAWSHVMEREVLDVTRVDVTEPRH